MKISVRDVEEALSDLLAMRRSREEIAAWAANARAEDDHGTLQYEPPTAEARIWEALEYLAGVDLRDSAHSYLHTQDDFSGFLESWRRE